MIRGDLCRRYVATLCNAEHQVDGRVSASLAVSMLEDVDISARLEGWAEVLERVAGGESAPAIVAEMQRRLTELAERKARGRPKTERS